MIELDEVMVTDSSTLDDPIQLGKYVWQKYLFPDIKEVAYQLDKLPNELVGAVQKWINMHSINRVATESGSPVNKQMSTERGLVYVVAEYDDPDDAIADGFHYTFTSPRLGQMFSRTTSDYNHREFAIVSRGNDR